MRQLTDLLISGFLLALRFLSAGDGSNAASGSAAGGFFSGVFPGPTIRGSWKRDATDKVPADDRVPRFRPGWWMIPGALLGIAFWVGLVMFIVWLL